MTAKELALQLGVSQAAVSLAFNDKPGISEETRQKILEAAEQYNVQRPSRKTALSSPLDVLCYRKHGLVFGETPFFEELIEGIYAAASNEGYTVRISYLYHDSPDTRVLLNRKESAGIILIATEMTDNSEIEPFVRLRQPIVILDAPFRYRSFPSVLINNTQGAYAAVRHLLDRGHRYIGHIRSSVTIFNFLEREEGFHAACREFPDCRTITVNVGSTQETAYADMLAWLQTKPELPTAFFADNDLIAISCIRAFKDMHYRIPQDVSIIGFDDIPMSAVSSPALTTIHVQKEEMGGHAVTLLKRMIQQTDQTPVHIRLCTSLIERKSVADGPIKNPIKNDSSSQVDS